MTIRHTAAVFSARDYVRLLEADYVLDGGIDLEKMRWDCGRRVTALGQKARGLLDILRYDPEWFSSPEPAPGLWCFVRLAEQTEPAPSLSQRRIDGYQVLSKGLAQRGWSLSETNRLIRGRSLDLLYSGYGAPGGGRFTGMDCFYSGWLSAGDCSAFLGRLGALKDSMSSDTVRTEYDEFADSLDDGIKMLDMACSVERDLLLILD